MYFHHAGCRRGWQFFRVAVNGSGYFGFQYDFSVNKQRTTDDHSFAMYGVEVVIDDMSLELMENAELDYVLDVMGRISLLPIPMPMPLSPLSRVAVLLDARSTTWFRDRW